MKTSNFNNSESKNNQVFNSRKEQYEAIKYGRPWYLLLFYWGAHYAAYDKDAETVAEVLDGMDGVTTYEECGMKCTVFPVDALAEALPKLRARNEYISICDNLSHNGLYSRRTLADILNRNKTGRYYGECTDVFTSSDDREQADVKAEGCEVVRHIYYRIDCPDYEAGHDIDAFYSEVVKLLEAEGWHVEGDWQGAHCPTMRKGAQSLYCHPQSLSGEVSPVECDRIGQVLMTGETFRLRGIDDYGRIFLTASEEQERDLYRQNYQDGLADMLREVLTTKRSNLYRDKGDALGNAYRRTAIENIRTDMEDKGSNYYYWRKAVTEFVDSEYDRLLQAGYIKEAEGQNGRTLCRWINKKEEKELNKARREAEKAEKVKETYKTGLLVTDKKFGHDYERITGIEEGMNTYVVTTATKIQVECMKHYRIMERAKNEHTVADLPEWVRPGAVLMINGTWKWEEVEIVELADGCVWYKKGNSVMGWTYDHFISLYVNHHYAKVKEYAPEPTLEDIGKFRAVCEAEGCTYPGDVEGTSEYYRDALLTAAEGQTVSYQFGNCRFDCKKNDKGTWDVHAYDTDGEDTTFEDRTASFFGGMFNDLFKTWGSGNLPSPDDIESLTAKYAKQIEESALLGCGCMVGDGDESRKDSKCVKVRTAYKNDSHDAKDWTYCVSWYETAPIKGDADGQRQTLRECENGILLEQAARHMAYFELMARKGWTLDEILYGKAA